MDRKIKPLGMTYRKFKADYLFTGKENADQDSVLITTPEGIVQAIVPAAEAGSDIVYYPGWLTPGFINCHCHLELSHMRGALPEGTGLVDFLSSVIRRRGEANGNVGEAMAAAEQEMLDNGIVAVGDICNTADTLVLKKNARLHYHNFIETIGFVDQGANMRFNASKLIFDQFETAFPGKNSIVPHAPYSVSPTLFKLIAGHAPGQLLSMHNQESEEENIFFLTGKGDLLRLYEALGVDVSFFTGTGKRSLESVLPYFSGEQTMILVHDVVTNGEDLRVAKDAGGPGVYFCLCPNANLYISGRLPDVELLKGSGVLLLLGTDSLASNHQLDILAEMKTLQKHFPQLGTATLLGWATVNGAKALGLESVLGRFEKGMRPGVVFLSNVEEGRLTEASRAQRLL
jgi:cytosine/adenosine deaminase-related metal-dependent hydrolase